MNTPRCTRSSKRKKQKTTSTTEASSGDDVTYTTDVSFISKQAKEIY